MTNCCDLPPEVIRYRKDFTEPWSYRVKCPMCNKQTIQHHNEFLVMGLWERGEYE